jgi:hypothetical protein
MSARSWPCQSMLSLFFMSPSRAPLLHCRLNSRDHIRTRLDSPAIMNTFSTFNITNPNPGRNGTHATRNIVTSDMEKGTTVPTSPEVRRYSHNVLSRADNIALTYRISPKSRLTVHCPRRCSHDESSQPSVPCRSHPSYSTFPVFVPMQSCNSKT